MKRRTWILSALGATGALVVGWGVMPARSRMGSPELMLKTEGDVALNGWIKIAQDGAVVLAMPRSEMGQGIHTALAMLVAEELDVPLARVRLEQAGADSIYGNVAMLVASLPFHPLDSEGEHKPTKIKMAEWVVGKLARELGLNATGGSSTIADLWDPLRMAAATARASLLQAAAGAWKVPASEISISQGVMKHASGKTAHFGEMATGAAGSTPKDITPKARKDWKLIGQATARTDIPAKVTGQAQFGLDVRLPGMLFAAVKMSPILGGSAASMDTKAALALQGVSKVVPLDAWGGGTAGLAVVGQSTWHARQGAQAVQVQWQAPSSGALDTATIQANLLKALNTESGFTFHEQGVPTQAEKSATTRMDALYQAPYLAHATMEPMNCTALFKDGRVELWAPTQVPQMARDMAAKVAGVKADQVTVHVTLLGGGFGRRLEVDFVGQAVQVAMACNGTPVQLSWSREEDMTHDFYRPMHLAKFQASLDDKGQVTSLRIKSAGDAITPRWMARAVPMLSGPIDMPDKTASEGLFDLPYGFASQHMSHVFTQSGVPVGFWRSVGHSHNAFFSESFIDELAVATQQDPLAFRLNWLKDAPRYAAVLKLAADKAGWGQPLPAGRARGMALHESFGSITAQVAEVSLDKGQIRVHRVVCAIDCGTVVNPDTVAQQVESSVLYGLSAALYGRIDIVGGAVKQSNFPSYPMVTLSQAPQVQTHIVPSERAPAGVGEPAVPPVAPAVGNALFALTGKRLRALPLVV
ncbi:xanthine dehydrogenase family protein molybdopterin-binding subunit [Limnohabitans sp. Jir72]|uniref:xanthine dehydrogenase family protein molybdopterin-binding subunit n=1 Tax=Limnohabitans sp. Jir72 TaxID=1977909 RepID=UPI000D3D067B|nr:xanthine dehydrogenase family protein molybdopterin-binding subunit [Limnohabitans sp. Jir72]PUE26500.1 acylaldehyde oxidase [Limnohabitans sp. Jir72]